MCKLLLSLVLLFSVFGCNQPKKVVNDQVQFMCNVRPIIITRTGTSSWTEDMVMSRINVVDQVYAGAKLCFNFQEIEYLEVPWLNETDEKGFAEICQRARDHAEQRGELAVYFLYSMNYKGTDVGGLSNFPSNLQGSIYQHGVVATYYSYEDVVAHELGHSFNLKHPWQDDVTDTPSSGPDDCDIWEKYCNIMSYCGDDPLKEECREKNLTTQQTQIVRNWAAAYPRTLATLSIGAPFTASAVPIYTNNIEPAMEPICKK